MRMTALSLSLLLATAGLAQAQDTSLTIYHSDDSGLFDVGAGGPSQAGYAVVSESRTVNLNGGAQRLVFDGLPLYVDGQGLSLQLPGASVLGQRVLLPQGSYSALVSLIGQPVEVLGDSGQLLGQGTLRSADGNQLLLAQADGQQLLVHNYAAVRSRAALRAGARVEVQVDGKHAGQVQGQLSYPTGGLGWQAAYIATLQPGARCSLQLQSRASVANRSGRDWQQVALSLVAGQVNGAGNPPARPVMMMAKAARADALPEASAMGDVRRYRLPGTIDLPDGSISQSPLYPQRTLDCQRSAVLDSGSPWFGDQPNLARGSDDEQHPVVTSTLAFTTRDDLPAGAIRVLQDDGQGGADFIGSSQLADTPKGQPVKLALGQVFDLSSRRQRTGFALDQAKHQLDESFRLVLDNAGERSRVVTVHEHPNRWHQWSVLTSSQKPSGQTPDTLTFELTVPAHGQATLDYTLRYQWSPGQERTAAPLAPQSSP